MTRIRISVQSGIVVDADHPIELRADYGDSIEFEQKAPDDAEDAIVPGLLALQRGRYVPVVFVGATKAVLRAEPA